MTARLLRFVSLVSIASLLLGCATILNGRHQAVTIETDPPGASVTILPEDIRAVTPARVQLRRSKTHSALIELEGYKRKIALIDRLTSAAVYWNILLGGLIGLIVDSSSGAAFRLEPTEISVDLTPRDDS